MNNKQKLRFVINEYWKILWQEDLYSTWKSNLWIKKSSELSDYIIERNIETYSLWIKDFEMNPENIEKVKKELEII